MQSGVYIPRVIVIINKAILRSHLEYVGMGEGEMMVVTWKNLKELMVNNARGPLLARS
jgi:hypothetical protein